MKVSAKKAAVVGALIFEKIIVSLSILAGVSWAVYDKMNSVSDSQTASIYDESSLIYSLAVKSSPSGELIGLLSNSPGCLNNSFLDADETRVNMETMKTCLGDTLGSYETLIFGTAEDSYLELPTSKCKLKILGDTTVDEYFYLDFDCSEYPQGDSEYDIDVRKDAVETTISDFKYDYPTPFQESTIFNSDYSSGKFTIKFKVN